jgi:hypothetical protein
VRRTRLGKLLSRRLEQLLVELNNDSNKLLKLPRLVRGEASTQLLMQAQKREQLRSLRVVETPQVLLQHLYHLNHDTAKQSSFQQNIDSYIYQSRHIELNTRRHRDNSDCTWLYSLKLQRCFGVQVALLRRWAARTVKLGRKQRNEHLSHTRKAGAGTNCSNSKENDTNKVRTLAS